VGDKRGENRRVEYGVARFLRGKKGGRANVFFKAEAEEVQIKKK